MIYNLTLFFESFVKYFHEEIPVATLFFLFLSLSLGEDYKVMERKLWKIKRCFSSEQTHSQKTLSVLQQMLSFERFKFIFVAYFQGLNYLIISCFSHIFPACIPINLRGIFKNQEIFLFIKDSFKITSLYFFTGVSDREI